MLSNIKNENKGLNPNKATTHNNVPPKILQQSAEVTANTLQLLCNKAISRSEFPENWKSDVTPGFKKKVPIDKTNYRPASVLPPVSKTFGRKKTNYRFIHVNTERVSVRGILYFLLQNVRRKPFMKKDLVEQFW